MIHIVDHLKEKESVIQLNVQRIKAALKRGEKVIVYHPVGKIHGRLKDIRGVEYVASKGLGEVKIPKPILSAKTANLINLWGKPIYGKLGVRPPKWAGRKIAFIHWMVCGATLQPIEVFHLNMLWALDAADFFDEIHIRIAGDGRVPKHASDALREVLGGGRAVLNIKGVRNEETWEWGTYTEFLNSARPDADMYYLHFKGSSHTPGSSRNVDPVFADYGAFTNIAFWSYVMYKALFTIRPTTEKPAVCGILHTNPVWTKKIGWDIRPYHASGSFQGYSGKALVEQKKMITKMLERSKGDIRYMRYTVEGMMTFLFGEDKIARTCDTEQRNLSMYRDLPNICPKQFEDFCKGPEYLICQR